MRWDRLFADLEAQLDADEAAAFRTEVADRRRREQARVDLVERLSAHRGRHLRVGRPGSASVDGVLADVTASWLLVEEFDGREALLPMAAVLWVEGLGPASEAQPEGSVTRRLGLGSALRSLAQQRVSLVVELVDGSRLTGTLDRVGSDHVDLAEHAGDAVRRRAEVRRVRTVAFAALAVLRPTSPTSQPGGSQV